MNKLSLRTVLQVSLQLLYKFLFRVEVQGHKNIPELGAVLICSNHTSNLDPPLIGCFLKRKVYFMAKEELFKYDFIGSIIMQLGAFPVKRGTSDIGAYKSALKVLKKGDVLGIFPEGKNIKTGKLGVFHQGAATFAIKTKTVIIPTAIVGKYRPFSKVILKFGKPINPREFDNSTMLTKQLKTEVEKLRF
ncbi:lysophospholipid acyltransferase family protein [Bacillus solimangrovi]|uniref:1-acyl-sn-glycerol-3-phosphate acyltransferase n=1 Tax=Bacillus solimangrovi TaxID=1305675 RepID=A0A1E5LBW4_9BACI|nr:lysophospholipid acyltransferase family protein [Bacillus solimangrovi]OEH91575.1 hypothetical protein BFG57_04155 [Bacillus solimangrovi]